MKRILSLACLLFLAPAADAQGILAALGRAEDSAGWKKNTISPVADMMEFEDPVVRTEIRPVFMYQNIANNYVTGGGYAMLAGAQVRLALTNRFALMVTKGGYMETHPAVGQHSGGWADLTFGFKYVLIDDMESNFILTAGMTATTPSGDRKILHGRGSGFLNPFLSFEKGWGDFHLMGTLVYNQALHRDSNSSHLHYGLNADYHACDWFIPFVSAVAWTVTDAGSAVLIADMIELALYLKQRGVRPRQVQDFIPTPMSMATAMYYTGADPFTRAPVYTAKDLREKKLQKALLLYWDPAQHHLARIALRKAGRADLIGHRPNCLVPPEPPLRAGAARPSGAGDADVPKVRQGPGLAGQRPRRGAPSPGPRPGQRPPQRRS